MSPEVWFYASSACAWIVIVAGCIAVLRGISWDRTPDGVKTYLIWMLVFFSAGLFDLLTRG